VVEEAAEGLGGKLDFLEHFSALADPRQSKKVLYPLDEVLFLTLCAVLCGADGWVGVALFGKQKLAFLRRFLPFANGTPSHDQLGLIFGALDATAFQACFIAWTQALSGTIAGVVAVDGKTLRRSFDRTGNKGAVHMVSAWSSAQKLVLGALQSGTPNSPHQTVTESHQRDAFRSMLLLLLILERATRIERATLTLARLCSTPELRPRPKRGVYGKRGRDFQDRVGAVQLSGKRSSVSTTSAPVSLISPTSVVVGCLTSKEGEYQPGPGASEPRRARQASAGGSAMRMGAPSQSSVAEAPSSAQPISGCRCQDMRSNTGRVALTSSRIVSDASCRFRVTLRRCRPLKAVRA
jgi:hypothetical protein